MTEDEFTADNVGDRFDGLDAEISELQAKVAALERIVEELRGRLADADILSF